VAVTNARLYEDAQAVAERYRQAVEDERRAREAVAQSEARYRNLFETATDAIYTLDPQGAFTSVNEATCELLGRDRADLLARSPLPFVSSNDTGMVKEQFKAALLGQARRYQCRFIRPDGVSRLASLTNLAHPPRVAGDRHPRRRARHHRRARARSALERSEIRYTQLVESASDAIFTADTSGLLTGVNRSLEGSDGKESRRADRLTRDLADRPARPVGRAGRPRAALAGEFRAASSATRMTTATPVTAR
jgi:PAS domain S-box-containing protein